MILKVRSRYTSGWEHEEAPSIARMVFSSHPFDMIYCCSCLLLEGLGTILTEISWIE